MLFFGKNITTPGDPLQPIALDQLFRVLTQPKPEFSDRIQQLRNLKALDVNAYRQQKKTLPYLVCGKFHPPVRRRENFSSIEYLILDVDHLDAIDTTPAALRARLIDTEPALLMAFLSPGADGLKLLFRLSSPCTDAALYSTFYKIFAHDFASRYGLMQVVDHRTSDVTRACFLSYDPEAYYNPQAQPLRIEDFVNMQDVHATERILEEAEAELRKESVQTKPAPSDPPADVLQRIRAKLNPNARRPRQKEYYVPPAVDAVLPQLRQKLPMYEMELVETGPINYGRRVKVQAGGLWAEINIFYGKRGFSVVKTTKSGSDPELAEVAAVVIQNLLADIAEGS